MLTQVALIKKELPKVGTRKLQYLLKDFFVQHGIKMGRDALFSLLMEEGLLVKKRKRKVSTTNSGTAFESIPTLCGNWNWCDQNSFGYVTSPTLPCKKAFVIYRSLRMLILKRLWATIWKLRWKQKVV